MRKTPFSILISGDLVVNQSYDYSKIDRNIINLFNKSDLKIVNLEAPVTKSLSKILKTGPHLKSEEQSTLDILKQLEVDVVTLANNHILDYDQKGVQDTLAFCSDIQIRTVGAGMNLKDATKTLYLNTKEGKIALVNFAENEWSSATEDTAGSNPMDIIKNSDQIKEAKLNAEYVIVIIHGGHEYYNLPSPRMQKQYRFYAEQGADIVVGHHTHCIGGFEEYKGVPIYYSLGNFLFTKNSNYEDWYIGIVLEIEIEKGEIRTKLHPIKQERESYKLSLLGKNDKQSVLNRISEYNVIIETPEILMKEWNNYVSLNYQTYLTYWSPISFLNNRWLKALFRKVGLTFLNKRGIALKLNLMRCEAHTDISKEITRKYLTKSQSQK